MDELPLEPYPLCQGIYSSQRSPTCIYCKGHVHPEITFETKNSEGELKSVGHLDSASNSDDSDEGDDKAVKITVKFLPCDESTVIVSAYLVCK